MPSAICRITTSCTCSWTASTRRFGDTHNQAILCAWAILSDGTKTIIHLEAAASLVADGAKQWVSISRLSPSVEFARPLFLDEFGDPLPTLESRQKIFDEYGWIRGKIDRRHTLRQPKYNRPEMTRMLLRKLIGVGVRAELLTYASFSETATTRDLARVSGYSQRRIQTVIADRQSIGVADWARARGVSEPIRFRSKALNHFITTLGSKGLTKSRKTSSVRWQDMLGIGWSVPRIWNLARQSAEVVKESGKQQIFWEMAILLGRSSISGRADFRTTEVIFSDWPLEELKVYLFTEIKDLFGD